MTARVGGEEQVRRVVVVVVVVAAAAAAAAARAAAARLQVRVRHSVRRGGPLHGHGDERERPRGPEDALIPGRGRQRGQPRDALRGETRRRDRRDRDPRAMQPRPRAVRRRDRRERDRGRRRDVVRVEQEGKRGRPSSRRAAEIRARLLPSRASRDRREVEDGRGEDAQEDDGRRQARVGAVARGEPRLAALARLLLGVVLVRAHLGVARSRRSLCVPYKTSLSVS
eukprot:30041-Pelagococcus_subviridis.AAC.9